MSDRVQKRFHATPIARAISIAKRLGRLIRLTNKVIKLLKHLNEASKSNHESSNTQNPQVNVCDSNAPVNDKQTAVESTPVTTPIAHNVNAIPAIANNPVFPIILIITVLFDIIRNRR